MNNEKLEFPFYAKATILLIGIIAFFAIMYIGRGIIIPIVFAIIIAILLQPVVAFFERKGINKVIAIIITLILFFAAFVALCFFIVSQASHFTDSWPILVEKFSGLLNKVVTEASEYFEVNPQKIQGWMTNTQDKLLNQSTEAIGKTLVTLGGLLVVLFLLPVYIFLILFYQPLLLDFIHRISGKSNEAQVSKITSETKSVIQHYLVGLIIETAIISTLYTTTLLILGIEYAFLLGILGAFLNLIPYIGGLVGVALPMVVALVTKSSPLFALYVLVIYYSIQIVDNNFLVPKIVASRVKINALFAIFAVIVGNALWGIPGMFLSIPLLAIVKLICDHIESLKPWGLLLGDTMPGIAKFQPIRLMKRKSKTT